MRSLIFLASTLILAAHTEHGALRIGREAASSSQVATVPFHLDHNRMILEVEFVRPDGSLRRTTAWVDTGSQFLGLSEALARELGLATPTPSGTSGGRPMPSSSPAPPLRLAGLPLKTVDVEVRIHPGTRLWPGLPAEAVLPASALRESQVIFDYPAHRLTIARHGTLTPRGVPVPCRVHAATGLFLVEVELDGERVALGLDTGSAGTWISTRLTNAWQKRHPEWPAALGAVGSTNFFGFPFETEGVVMRLPDLKIGSLSVRDVPLLGVSQELFDWYSQKSAAPVVGFLGANVLKRFRLETDFVRQTTYWQPAAEVDSGDLDIVGLTVRPEADGGFTVAGVTWKKGRPTVEGIESGARLLKVGELDVTGATMGEVVEALRGRPGETRRLVVDQNGATRTVEAPVTRFP